MNTKEQDCGGRLAGIDMLKGFGIVSVVTTHVIAFNKDLDTMLATKIVYMFHMPLFFFLSGYLSSTRGGYVSFFIQKFRQFIIPYFVYLLTIYMFDKFVGDRQLSLKNALLGGEYLFGYLGAFWFVPCLFLTQQLCNYILSRCTPQNCFIIICCAFTASLCNDLFFDQIKFPYNINVILGALPIYYLGHVFRQYDSKSMAMFGALLGIAGALLLFFGLPNYYNMKAAFYGIPGITLLCAVGTVVALKFCFSLLPAFRFGVDLGKASLVILYLHQFLQIYMFYYITQNQLLRIIVGTLVPLFAYYIISKWSLSRALFLGSVNDQNAVWEHGSKLIYRGPGFVNRK